MNHYRGVISDLLVTENMTLVRIKVNEVDLTSIVLDLPSQISSLAIGHPIEVLFKETAVMLLKEGKFKISSRNQISGTITEIVKGALLARIELASTIGVLHAVITSEAVEDLSLQKGDQATALIKTNEITLAYD